MLEVALRFRDVCQASDEKLRSNIMENHDDEIFKIEEVDYLDDEEVVASDAASNVSCVSEVLANVEER